MKHLNIEEKAHRYDEAIERANSLLSGNQLGNAWIYKLLPELQKSEDERIRNFIIKVFKDSQRNGISEAIMPEQYDKVFAWLEKHDKKIDVIENFDTEFEKQCEQKLANSAKTCKNEQKSAEWHREDEHNLNACLGYIPDEYLRRWLMDVVHVKYDKHDDKVEPKFHEGEWIVHHGTENIYQVVAVIDNQYQLKYGDTYTVQRCADVDRCARLWDVVKDAKDGDVLSYRDGQWIFIYKEKIDDSSFYYHTLYSTIHQDLTINDSAFTLLGDAIIPATKEQSDLLFQKMKENGYEWDAEKKELKKIEPKPWSEEDERMIDTIISDLERHGGKEGSCYSSEINYLKSLKDRYTCNPSKE